MNPKGVNLTDVWNDIPPVRHWKFKSRKRSANQLSTKLVERIIRMSTRKDQLVLDPFGGSGTTYDVCERLKRRWIGIEVESCDVIIERLKSGDLSPHKSEDHVEIVQKLKSRLLEFLMCKQVNHAHGYEILFDRINLKFQCDDADAKKRTILDRLNAVHRTEP